MSQKSEGKNRESGRKYRALIIGAGGQGALSDAPGSGKEEKIISFAHALKEHPGFKWLAFYDEIEEKAYLAKEIWGGTWFIALDEIGDHHIDVAIVSTPDDSHYEILKQLAEYPLRLVIVEKPICTDLQQAREIVELYKAKGIPLAVNYTRRFIPELQELKQRYEAGEFGKLLHYNINFNRGLIHSGSHAVDFLGWLFDYDLPRGLMLTEIEADYRIWQIDLFFEKFHWREERITNDMPVPSYFDKHTWYVVDNAYNFLEGREPLKCDGEQALKALEICYNLMREQK